MASSSPSPPGSSGTGTGTGTGSLRIRLAHPQLQGQRPQAVHIDRNAGQVRLDMGHGNVVSIPFPQQAFSANDTDIPQQPQNEDGNGNGNHQPPRVASPTTFNVRIAQQQLLPPLIPQPIIDDRTANLKDDYDDDDEDDDDDSLTKFKCAVCYEYMRDPVGCPSEACSSRFCRSCFVRSAKTSSIFHHQTTNSDDDNNNDIDTNGDTNTRTTPKPKCPTCRVEFSHLVEDKDLKREMIEGDRRVSCRHMGCRERKTLLLGNVQEHESQCRFERVKCRYASFGCSWTGTRGTLEVHESNECALEKVKVLVDKFRKLELEHTSRLNLLRQQSAGNIQMLQIYRQNAERDLAKSTANIFDLFKYIHVVTCSTLHFLQTKERWQAFYRLAEGQAAVINFALLLPITLVSARFAMVGSQSSLSLLFDDVPEVSTSSGGQSSFQILLEDSIMGLLIGLLAILLLAVNLLDSTSSVVWGKIALPGLGSQPVMCDLMAISFFTILLGVLDSYGSVYKSVVVWILLGLATVFFPTVVLPISQNAARGFNNDLSKLSISATMEAVRCMQPVLFGLRFSIIGTFFGILPTLDAATMLAIFQPLLHHHRFQSLLFTKNCALEGLTPSVSLAYLVAKTAIVSYQNVEWKAKDVGATIDFDTILSWLQEETVIREMIIDSFVAFFAVMLASMVLNIFLLFGLRCGETTYKRAKSEVSTRSLNHLQYSYGKDYEMIGVVSFSIWILSIGMLLSLV